MSENVLTIVLSVSLSIIASIIITHKRCTEHLKLIDRFHEDITEMLKGMIDNFINLMKQL